MSTATVGTPVASRRPGHPVGWLLLGFGLSLCAAGLALAYANYGVAHPDVPAVRLQPTQASLWLRPQAPPSTA